MGSRGLNQDRPCARQTLYSLYYPSHPGYSFQTLPCQPLLPVLEIKLSVAESSSPVSIGTYKKQILNQCAREGSGEKNQARQGRGAACAYLVLGDEEAPREP